MLLLQCTRTYSELRMIYTDIQRWWWWVKSADKRVHTPEARATKLVRSLHFDPDRSKGHVRAISLGRLSTFDSQPASNVKDTRLLGSALTTQYRGCDGYIWPWASYSYDININSSKTQRITQQRDFPINTGITTYQVHKVPGTRYTTAVDVFIITSKYYC